MNKSQKVREKRLPLKRKPLADAFEDLPSVVPPSRPFVSPARLMKSCLFRCVVSLSFVAFFFAVSLAGAERPTPDEVRRVIEYYYGTEKTRPVLLQIKLCRDFERSGKDKFECVGELSRPEIDYGKDFFVWLNFFWNKGQSYDVIVNFSLKGVSRRTYNYTLPDNGSIRYRVPLEFPANRKGDWTVSVFHDDGTEPELLDSIEVSIR